MNKKLDSWKIFYFRILEIDKEIEVIPNIVILFFVFFKSIFFSIKQLNIHSTNIAFSLFVGLSFFSLLSNLGKFIHNNSSKNLFNNDFDYK